MTRSSPLAFTHHKPQKDDFVTRERKGVRTTTALCQATLHQRAVAAAGHRKNAREHQSVKNYNCLHKKTRQPGETLAVKTPPSRRSSRGSSSPEDVAGGDVQLSHEGPGVANTDQQRSHSRRRRCSTGCTSQSPSPTRGGVHNYYAAYTRKGLFTAVLPGFLTRATMRDSADNLPWTMDWSEMAETPEKNFASAHSSSINDHLTKLQSYLSSAVVHGAASVRDEFDTKKVTEDLAKRLFAVKLQKAGRTAVALECCLAINKAAENRRAS